MHLVISFILILLIFSKHCFKNSFTFCDYQICCCTVLHSISHTTLYLLRIPLMSIHVTSSSLPQQIMWQWAFSYKVHYVLLWKLLWEIYLCLCLCLCLYLYLSPQVELLSHRVYLYLIWLSTTSLLLRMTVPVSISISSVEGFCYHHTFFSHHPPRGNVVKSMDPGPKLPEFEPQLCDTNFVSLGKLPKRFLTYLPHL